MPPNQKPELYQIRKATGVPLTRPFMNYTTDQLKRELAEMGVPFPGSGLVETPVPKDPHVETYTDIQWEEPEPPKLEETTVLLDEPKPAPYPMSNIADPEEMAGQRLNQRLPDDVIRVDDEGRLWYQEEVRKPAYPKPRGRRVLTYIERGVETETVQNGEYIETFEVAGKAQGKTAEVKITLPSYQVGIYRDPRFPFKIHTYNDREGFNLFEVHEFYGGAELVPESCKRIYIENDLCYDIRSVVRTIQAEHRQLQLMGKI